MISLIKIPQNKNFKFLILFFFILFIYTVTTSSISNLFDPSLLETSMSKEKNLMFVFFMLVVVAPIFETLIYQTAVIEILLKFKIGMRGAIVISALLFGLSHSYSFIYILLAIGTGFVLAYYYASLREQGKINKILFVTILHALINLVVFIHNHIFNL